MALAGPLSGVLAAPQPARAAAEPHGRMPFTRPGVSFFSPPESVSHLTVSLWGAGGSGPGGSGGDGRAKTGPSDGSDGDAGDAEDAGAKGRTGAPGAVLIEW